jgi:hypothetical protein
LGFTFSRPRWTQHLLDVALLAGAFAIGRTSAFAEGLERLVALGSEPTVFIASIWVLHEVVFWAVVLAFLYVDNTDRPRFISRYRIQDGPIRRPPTPKVRSSP